ncbi:hypothetical protein [Aureimonas sp. Leaf324]|uniref:hypothetical protein n=1 Tax=Aureimonas sp. Leaf324 TaxID=1736336 RepID=UPI0006F86501|nr:hypothetical protein [Aureimonas sp. Leaf324]KQQ84197.1 hypothetical protein ASF65_20340 [Aureimonas sp. Leaf324]
MPSVPTALEEILGMAQARRDRAAARAADGERRGAAASGSVLPSADQLLHGHPPLGGDIRTDIQEFVGSVPDGSVDREAAASLRALSDAARRAAPGGGVDGVAVLAALRACRIAPPSDPDGTLRLRCVIYAALLGDAEAALAVAGEAALLAYVQDWHLEGDGTELVWQAAAWAAFGSSRLGPLRRLPWPISEMGLTRDRIDAFADEFRLKVSRHLPELE